MGRSYTSDWSHKTCSKFFWISYILSFYILTTTTRSSSTHWKLILDETSGRHIIMPSIDESPEKAFVRVRHSPIHGRDYSSSTTSNGTKRDDGPNSSANSTHYLHHIPTSPSWALKEDEDLVFQILTTTVVSSRGSWTKNGHEVYCSHCPMLGRARVSPPDRVGRIDSLEENELEILDCGRPANFTYYDQLIGIANRQNHPHIPEPQVALLFRKKNSKKDAIDLMALERKLRKAKKEKPSSVQLYNQIGNFWRIKGHTLRAIECFRRALAVAPNNPEVLHNMARLLLMLQYLDDALFLARRSLELQAPDRSAWQQHFTLGEILKSYGHHQEALLHFKHTLELRPDHVGAQEALRDLESLLSGTGLHICTLLIIISLVVGVLLVMLSSLECEEGPDLGSRPTPRHFSRALAMRSLKLGISPRALRAKRFSSS